MMDTNKTEEALIDLTNILADEIKKTREVLHEIKNELTNLNYVIRNIK